MSDHLRSLLIVAWPNAFPSTLNERNESGVLLSYMHMIAPAAATNSRIKTKARQEGKSSILECVKVGQGNAENATTQLCLKSFCRGGMSDPSGLLLIPFLNQFLFINRSEARG